MISLEENNNNLNKKPLDTIETESGDKSEPNNKSLETTTINHKSIVELNKPVVLNKTTTMNDKLVLNEKIMNTTCELLRNKKPLSGDHILELFNYLYGNKEKGIIVSDNKDFVINSFLKKVFSLNSEIKLNKIEINELNKGEIIKLRLTHLLLLLNIVNPNTLNSNIFNKKELNSNVENNEQYNWFENMTRINIYKEIYKIGNDLLLLFQDKELVNSNENHDELYRWLYKLIDRILKSYNYELDTSYIKTLYKLCYEMENKNKKIIQTQNLVSTELVLLNFLLQILSYLKVSDKELIKINEEELKARNELYTSWPLIFIILISLFIVIFAIQMFFSEYYYNDDYERHLILVFILTFFLFIISVYSINTLTLFISVFIIRSIIFIGFYIYFLEENEKNTLNIFLIIIISIITSLIMMFGVIMLNRILLLQSSCLASL